jgi:hypothetical protein
MVRFEEHGYSPIDLASLASDCNIASAITKPLSDEGAPHCSRPHSYANSSSCSIAWDALSEKLLPMLAIRKAARLESEALQRLEDACVAHWKTLPPALVPYMPSVAHVQEFEPVARALRDSAADFGAALAAASADIRRTIDDNTAALARMLPAGAGALERADAVFQTQSAFSHVCFGREVLASVFTHTRFRALPRVQFSTQAHAAVACVLRAAGADAGATRKEMDRHGARFVCMTCRAEQRYDPVSERDAFGRYVWDWRGAVRPFVSVGETCAHADDQVEHIVQIHPTTGQKAHVRVLNERERSYACEQEEHALEIGACQAFGCTLCNAHIGPKESSPWMARNEVRAHLKSE